MVEFCLCAHGVRRGEIEAGDNVLVVGAGPIGLGAAMFAKIAGANVALLDINESRLRRAEELVPVLKGFRHMRRWKRLEDFTNGDMFNVVLDATGTKRAMESSIRFVCHGGSRVFVSVVKDNITFEDPFFHAREMRLIGSRNATREDFDHVVKCIEDGLIQLTSSIPTKLIWLTCLRRFQRGSVSKTR